MSYGFTFNGTHCSVYGVVMKSKNRQVLPGINDSYLQIPGRQGSYLFPRELADRTIELDCGLVQDTMENLRSKLRQVAAWLYTTDRQSLSFDDESGIYYMAKLDDVVDLDQFFTMGKSTLKFRCEPLGYGAEVQANFANDAVTVTNSGTFEAYPVFSATFTAAATEWKVTLGGKYLRVVRNFAVNDILDINCLTGSVLVNGVRALVSLDWENSEFFALAVGNNALIITPTGKCTATVTFSPRWL